MGSSKNDHDHIDPLDTRHNDAASGTHRRSSSTAEKPHPSEFLEFATVPGSGVRLQPLNVGSPTANRATSPSATVTNPTHSNDALFEGLSQAIPNLRRLSIEARAAAKAEHRMGFFAGCRTYPKAILWSAMLSLTIVMEGYDLTLINSFFAFPTFRRNYGTLHVPVDPNQQPTHQISPAWQSGLTNAAVTGEILGLMLNGYLTDRFGYHKTMVFTLVWMSLFVFLAFFAVNIEMLLAAQVLCGLPWGIFQTLSTTYAAEVMPVVLRSYLTSNVNLCWLIGQLLGSGIVRAMIHNTSEWSYRIPFGLQWAFAIPILVGVCFAPESPWWLVRHDKPGEAKRALKRLTSDGGEESEFNADETISMMIHTNEVEKYLSGGKEGYMACFRQGSDRRRTEIACMVWVTQAMCGSTLTGYAAYFYEAAGFDVANSFNLTVGMYGIAICGHIMSWFWMRRIGRRTLYLTGLVLSFLILVAGGAVGTVRQTEATSWALGSLIIVLTGVYDSTIGPVCYVLVAEIPSSRLRVKTVVLARVAYNIVSILTNIVTPRMLNPSAWDWAGKSCYFYAGTTVICLVWCWWRLPEPFGLTYLELDILFEKKAKARKFKEFQVNLANSGYFSLTNQGRDASVASAGGMRAGSAAAWVPGR
jgi:MFS transporter, SP family, general alpha glucoside:H+ symporter